MTRYKPNCFVALMTDGEGRASVVIEIADHDAVTRRADISIGDGDEDELVDAMTANLGESIEQLARMRSQHMTTLRYRDGADIEDLGEGECTIRRTSNAAGTVRWWSLWFCVRAETPARDLSVFDVPVNPNGPFTEQGPGGRTWGLTRVAAELPDASSSTWQISPSINVLAHGERFPGDHEAPSVWHQTPTIHGVGEGAVWTREAP